MSKTLVKIQEKWDIIIYNPNYMISNTGKVLSVNRNIILKPQIDNGYHRVNLYLNGNMKHYCIHRLVAEHFINNPKVLPEVNHKDGNKANNNVSNLEWITTKGNAQHAYKTNLRYAKLGENCSWSKLTEEQVLDIRERYKIGAFNMRELSEYFQVNKTTIWEIIHRKIWRHI